MTYIQSLIQISAPAYWFVFHGNKILVENAGGEPKIPLLNPVERILALSPHAVSIGNLDGVPCFTTEVERTTDTPVGMEYSDLRPLLTMVSERHFSMAGRAFQIIDWERKSRFCSRCGAPLQPRSEELAKECPACGLIRYPPVVPAIIVAVVRDGKILLAHSHRFKFSFYSVLAGFVEPGETLEECVRREVREEVGIEVADVKYFGSLPWPFPNVLMMGFTARYAGGEIVVDNTELTDAAWFGSAELPPIPGKGTIARQLIDWFIGEQSKT
ncbi:MAG TPA: NAD(+) diphosphatase [Dissulfurispiraceae bacterium]|nr:NAD(+) diphosphatase [Dissulfurispiraceae bacterium]